MGMNVPRSVHFLGRTLPPTSPTPVGDPAPLSSMLQAGKAVDAACPDCTHPVSVGRRGVLSKAIHFSYRVPMTLTRVLSYVDGGVGGIAIYLHASWFSGVLRIGETTAEMSGYPGTSLY